MATAVIPSATALLRARRRDDGSVELHHVPGHDPRVVPRAGRLTESD